jgi:23S rRNA pseudouridine1911/1915/1917 synthase
MTASGDLCSTVPSAAGGERLDCYLSSVVDRISRSRATRLIKEGYVQVDGRCVKPGHRVAAGEVVSCRLPEPQPVTFLPQPLPLDILYEDREIIVVNKAAGMVVHPAPGHPDGTLVNALLYRCPDLAGIGGEVRPGIVHRLDRDTSGVMVCAKNESAHLQLAAQFRDRQVSKQYLALLQGTLRQDSGSIELPVGRHPTERKRMSVQGTRGRHAETRFKVLKRFGPGICLVEVDLRTGRTHQIRVHFSAIGHPVMGDPVYGGRKGHHRRIGQHRLQRQLLHAARLSLNHPVYGDRMTFEAPLPEDMQAVLALLEGQG